MLFSHWIKHITITKHFNACFAVYHHRISAEIWTKTSRRADMYLRSNSDFELISILLIVDCVLMLFDAIHAHKTPRYNEIIKNWKMLFEDRIHWEMSHGMTKSTVPVLDWQMTPLETGRRERRTQWVKSIAISLVEMFISMYIYNLWKR